MANVEHNVLTDPELHEPKGVAAAAANQVYVADGATSGDWTQITPTNVVVVHSASDFPTAVAGVRTLAANTVYHVVGAVSIGSDRLVMSSQTVLKGNNPNYDIITTTSSGVMITATSVDVLFDKVGLACTSGTFVSFDGNSGVNNIEMIDCVVNSDTLGTVTDALNALLSSTKLTGSTAGLVFAGAHTKLVVGDCKITVSTASAICVDLGTATFDVCVFSSTEFDNAASVTGLDIAAAGANMNSGKVGKIHECTFTTVATATNYVDGDDQWIISKSVGAGDSQAAATGYIESSALNTTFAGTGVGNEVAVNFGAAFTADLQRKFTVSTAGVFTYTAEIDTVVFANATIYSTVAGGTARVYSYQWAKNGTVIPASFARRQYDGSNPGANSCSVITTLSKNDTLTLYVRADTATTSLNVDTCSIQVTEIKE